LNSENVNDISDAFASVVSSSDSDNAAFAKISREDGPHTDTDVGSGGESFGIDSGGKQSGTENHPGSGCS
jgi:hypothetical protein